MALKSRFLIIVLLILIAIAFIAKLRFAQPPEPIENVLRHSDQFILYSLAPYIVTKPGTFHQYKIIGQTTIADPKLKARLINALYKAISEVPQNTEDNTTGMACHYARHGIRATKGNRTIDATICFECKNVYFYENCRDSGAANISRSAQSVFTRALVAAGVPLSKE